MNNTTRATAVDPMHTMNGPWSVNGNATATQEKAQNVVLGTLAGIEQSANQIVMPDGTRLHLGELPATSNGHYRFDLRTYPCDKILTITNKAERERYVYFLALMAMLCGMVRLLVAM